MDIIIPTFNPTQARLFLELVAMGRHIVPPSENHVPLILTPYCLIFLKVCSMLDHLTHFGFHGNRFKCFKVALWYFFHKNLKLKTQYKLQRFCNLMEVQILKLLCTPIKGLLSTEVLWVGHKLGN